MNPEFSLCFDLSFNSEIKQFLPSAYIAKIINNQIDYVEKKATKETINSFEIDISEDFEVLLNNCNSLTIAALEKKYNEKNKAKKPITELLKDSLFKKAFDQYFSFKLNIFLETCKKINAPLCCNLNREIPFGLQQISFGEKPLKSVLKFEKVTDKIIYTFSLDNDALFYPSEKQTKLLLNMPGWVCVDKMVYQLEHINSNKILPFLNKKTVEIPDSSSQKYFETFIKDMANKVAIEASGFEMIQKTTIQKCSIKPIFNFFSNNYLLEIIFEYEQTSFSYSDNKQLRSNVVIDNQISIIQTKRNTVEEKNWIEKASNLGLNIIENKLFAIEKTVSSGKYETIQWLINNKKQLENEGFSVENIGIENKKISSDFGTISTKFEENQDWFDVEMQITCGTYVFPFVQIVPNIKSNNPFFELPNGQFFLIPDEWFSQYKIFIEMGKMEVDKIRIRKSQLPVLEKLLKYDVTKHSDTKNTDFELSKNLKATLRNYQKEGVNWLINHHHNKLGACLADDMGLGKTLQTLAVLMYVKDQLQPITTNEPVDLFSAVTAQETPLKALIVAPSSLLFNWRNETKKFTPSLKSIVYNGSERKELKSKLERYDLVFTTYPIVLKDIDWLQNLSFRYLILDESQYIKNKNSKIFQALNQIQTEHKISLSGTPIENSLDDLWSQMQFINPNLLGEYSFFVRYFKNPIQKNKDENAIEELKNLIKPYILRRTKSQVAKDLPPISEHIFYSEMQPEQCICYEKEKSIVRNFILMKDRSNDQLSILNSLMKLRQLGNHPKLVDADFKYDSGKFLDVIEYLETLLKAKQKVLLFSSFVKHIDIYTDWCKKNKHSFCLLTGETPTENRENEVHQFQNNPDKLLFFISLKAGGFGLNLTAATYILILDPWWNPFE